MADSIIEISSSDYGTTKYTNTLDCTSKIYQFSRATNTAGKVIEGSQLVRTAVGSGAHIKFKLKYINSGWLENSDYKWSGLQSTTNLKAGDTIKPEYFGGITLKQASVITYTDGIAVSNDAKECIVNEDWIKGNAANIFTTEFSNNITFFAKYYIDGCSTTATTIGGCNVIQSCEIPTLVGGEIRSTWVDQKGESSCVTFVNGKGVIAIGNNQAVKYNDAGTLVGRTMNIIVYMKMVGDNGMTKVFQYNVLSMPSTYGS